MCHMWNVKIFQSVMYLVTQLGMKIFIGKKKVTPFFLTCIIPTETTRHLDIFFFFIQRWNIKVSNIFCLWWATRFSHFLHLLFQPFRWKNMFKERIFHSWKEWNFWFQHIGKITLFLDFDQLEWINLASLWTCKNCEAVAFHFLFPAQSKLEHPLGWKQVSFFTQGKFHSFRIYCFWKFQPVFIQILSKLLLVFEIFVLF